MAGAISVVIAARNAGRTLASTLDSLRAQSSSAAEVIVVDDGSSDGTGGIAHAAGAHVIRTGGIGLPAARNLGARQASSPLLAFVDGDDLFTPDHLDVHASCLMARGADAVATDAWYWVQGRVTPFSHFECSRPSDPLRVADLLRGNPLLSSCVIKAEALQAVGGYDEELPALEDYDLWLRLTEAGFMVRPAPRPTMYYRREAGMSADAAAMYHFLEQVLAKWKTKDGGAAMAVEVERHAAVGAGNWSLLGGDHRKAREHWRRAREMGDRRLTLMALLAGASIAPPVVRWVLERRLTVDGRPLPLEVVRWWRTTGHTDAVLARPDREQS